MWQPFHIQLLDLTLMQLTNWRWSWRYQIISGVIAPMVAVFGLGVFAQNSGPEALAYVMTGNMVLSLIFGTVGTVSGNFSYMRMTGMLDYFATLPIYRIALILASVLAFLALSLPPALITLVLGTLVLQIPLAISPLIVIILPLISISLCGLGALIGIASPSPQAVNTLSNLATFALLALGPVVIPSDRLSGVLQALGFLSPATYAASALRQVVLARPDSIPLLVDLVALILWSGVFLWIVSRHIDWRRA